MTTSKTKPQIADGTLPPVVGSPNPKSRKIPDTPRVTKVLAGMVEPLAKANGPEEFTAALKAGLQDLIEEAKKLERENVRQEDKLVAVFSLAVTRSRRGRLDRELYAALGIDLDRVDSTSNPKVDGGGTL